MEFEPKPENRETTPEEAKRYFEQFFGRKWNKRKDESLLRKNLKEIVRLRTLYPDVYDKVYNQLDEEKEE
jgi:hypothetical protein